MKKLWHTLAALVLAAGCVLSCNGVCMAAQITANGVYKVSEDTQLKEKAQEDADDVVLLEAGTSVIVVSFDADGWCGVQAGDYTGYLRKEVLTGVTDAAALDSEFDSIGRDYENTYNEVLETQAQERSSRIWGAVIVVLVAAIFATGIIQTVRNNRAKEGETQ